MSEVRKHPDDLLQLGEGYTVRIGDVTGSIRKREDRRTGSEEHSVSGVASLVPRVDYQERHYSEITVDNVAGLAIRRTGYND
jgi:hypothetical protein